MSSETSSILSKDGDCIHTKIVPADGSATLKCQMCHATLFPTFLKEFHQLQNSNHGLSEKNHYLNNKLSQLKESNVTIQQQFKDLTYKYEQLQGIEAGRTIEHELQIQDLSSTIDKLTMALKTEQDKSLFYLEEKNAINTELQELSRALFEEANGMVAEENKKNFYLEQDNRMQKTKISILQDELFNERLQLKELRSKVYTQKESKKSTLKWFDKIDSKLIDQFQVFTFDLKDLIRNNDDNIQVSLPSLVNLVNTHPFMQPLIQEMQLLLKNKIVVGILIENILRDVYKLEYYPVDPNISRQEKPKSPVKGQRPTKCIICENDLYFHPYYQLSLQSATILSKTTLTYHLCMYCRDKVVSICDLVVFIKHVGQNLYKKSEDLLYTDLIKYRIDMLLTKVASHKLTPLLTEAIDNNIQIDASASSLDITMSSAKDPQGIEESLNSDRK